VLIVSGKATVTPHDGSCGPITLSAGDSVHFHKGFSCAWHVLEPMTKRYNYFNEAGEIDSPAEIACDGCGAECVAQSWLTAAEEDICPACYKAAGGATGRYAGAEYQEQGEACAEPPAAEPTEDEDKKRPAADGDSDAAGKKAKTAA
jgi:hypothetical protein